ncbi:laminin subunit alpha-5-like [Actinia tenebrosa]|uniref:Laminin subunit alpha-5-like n=1 Tax=Actinia tenebrosa TaxID=6105 RepID=A0A6P8HGN4_ACTTE|nr:laminin subunit alpha-5-like [Actinia tenebrosa]
MFSLVVVVVALLGIKNVIAECFDGPEAKSEHIVCIPGHWDIAKLHNARITATSTCGTPPETYCRLKPMNGCFKCNSSNSDDSHPAKYIVDKSTSPTKWWQSETWWKWHQTHPTESLQVNITLSFSKSFDMTGLLALTFESPRPLQMILEKSSDWGRSWITLQYYASNCEQRFNMETTDPLEMRLNDSKPFCTEKYSLISPQRGGKVFFDFKTRYDEEADFFHPFIQEYLHTTDLRIRLEYPGTNGLENGGKTEDILNQFYYAISDLSIIGRCKCYGHARYCDYGNNSISNTTKCECLHNTDGFDCERCLPLYNNRTWQPATSKYEPNPCERCECNDHADACAFNKDLGFGVCEDCKHNTAGYFCHECQDKFYRNTSLPLNHPLVCPACDCYMEGIINNGTCNQTNGQCECRHNVTGRQCDRCVDTYYGYTNDPQGHCTACKCVETGTVNGSLNCEQVTGQCHCKPNIDQRMCSRCKDGYYKFPKNISEDCLRCDCDYGGSTSGLCNKIYGTCECRRNIQGTRCTLVPQGYYTGSLTHFKIEAEQSEGTYQYTANTEDLNKYFTGTGYAKISSKQFVNLNFKSNTTFKGYAVLRYTSAADSIGDLQMKIVGKDTVGCAAFTSSTESIRGLQKGNGTAWRSNSVIDICKGQEYSFNVSFTTVMDSSIQLDSLILLPLINETKIYDIASKEGHAHGIDASTIHGCWVNATSIVATNQSLPVCENVTFSVMTEVLDGALPCQCNSVGSIPNTFCDKQGGQCQCKPGVTGQSCDQCMPGYYNFTSEGCTACDCSSLGSHHLVCDAVTGQCPCRPGVITRACSRCNHTYYGFNTGKGCVECKCNASGSADMQCDGDTGKCPCKNSTRGDKCDECNHGFYNYTSTGCQSCNCDQAGSSTLQCHLETGECTCKKNVLGFKCDECKPSTYNRDVNNPHGCTPCFCFDRSGNCSSAKGFVKSFITSSPGSDDGWALGERQGISKFEQDAQKLSLRFSPPARQSLTLPEDFKRYHLRSYGELITFNLTYTGASSVKANWSLNVESRIGITISFPLQPPSSINITYYYVRLHEAYASTMVSARQLQKALSDIFTMKIVGEFYTNGSLTLSEAKLHMAVQGTIGEPAGNVENCTCQDEKFTGLSCELCGEGYTRISSAPAHNTSRFSYGCELCSCTNRSIECDPENGTCKNCRIGTEGNKCELCEPNVDNSTDTDCTRCFPGYYGLYLQGNPRGCSPCGCLEPNTLYGNQTVCQTGLNASTDTGQCVCKADITGRTCDRCHENAYNDSKGHCIDCPECYRLLQVFVHDLRTNITGLVNSTNRVRNGRIGDETFAKRLETSKNNVRQLVLKAQNSTGVEKELHDELVNLNKSLDYMESVLKGEVTSGVTSVEGVATKASKERNTTEELMKVTQTLVIQAYRLLSSSISMITNQTKDTEGYLAGLVPRFGTYANEASTISAKQNETGQDILRKTLTAEGLVRDADSISIATASDHQVNIELIRRLKLETEAVKELGVRVNDSAYAVFANTSVVLSNAQRALRDVNSLKPDNSLAVQQILNNATKLVDNATQAVQVVKELYQNHSTLISNVEKAVRDTKVLISRVTSMDGGATAMLAEARRAEAEAQAAVDLSNKTHEDMKEMLQILNDFETKANESKYLAQHALEKSKQANETSNYAIEYSQNISASIQAALDIATDGLEMARKVQNLSKEENKIVSAVFSQAIVLQGNADSSTHTPEILISKNTSTSNIGQIIKQPIKSCEENYSRSADFAKKESEVARVTSEQASQGINSAKNGVDRILSEIPHLQQVNATRLSELQEEIKRLRENFSQKNVQQLNAQLKVKKDKQQSFIDDYKTKLQELRTQVEEMKLLRSSLSSVPHRGCT